MRWLETKFEVGIPRQIDCTSIFGDLGFKQSFPALYFVFVLIGLNPPCRTVEEVSWA